MSNKSPDTFSINKFKKIIEANGGLSRQNYFTCSFDFNVLADNKLNNWNRDDLKNIVCKSATLPAFTVESAELGYFGRRIKIPSNRTYAPMTLNFTNTGNNKVRDILFYWQSALNTPFTNVRNLYGENSEGSLNLASGRDHSGLYADITLTHYDVNGGKQSPILGNLGIVSDAAAGVANVLFNTADHRPIAKYYLQQAFPTSIGGLNFSHEMDEFQTFEVQFVYQSMGFEFL